ncbi:MAG: hypothetical protein Q8L81_09100 [Bacteroidota bacterium]|nr:hypothetical protein [Bacteroidota bacterium]
MEKNKEVAIEPVNDRYIVFIGSAIVNGPSVSASQKELKEFFDYTKKYNTENKNKPARVCHPNEAVKITKWK